MTIPSILWRVVWAFDVIIESLSPTKAFIKVDFPTFGFPIMFTKPALCTILMFFLAKVMIIDRLFELPIYELAQFILWVFCDLIFIRNSL